MSTEEEKQRQDKKKENKIKETIPIEEEAVAFVIGKEDQILKESVESLKILEFILNVLKEEVVLVILQFLLEVKVINEVIEMLLESEEIALKKKKKINKKRNESSENEEEIKITPEPEPEFKPTFDETNKWADDI